MFHQQLFNNIQNLKVAVVGDIMLDAYLWGTVERISPEAPVPIVSVQSKDFRVGGAANVALNTVALKAETYLFSVIGNDTDANVLLKLLKDNNIIANGVIQSSNRITTNKTRVLAKNQQVCRLDAEVVHDIDKNEEEQLINAFTQLINNVKLDVVILEDYNKGVLTKSVIEKIIKICKDNHIITCVDPKRKNFLAYTYADIFKPNLKEVKEALNILNIEVNLASMQEIHQKLKEHLQHSISFITLSEKGVFYQTNHVAEILPAHVRLIADVSGAGDTTIAVAALVYASTQDFKLAATIANLAGGLVCEEVGTVAINATKLQDEVQKLLAN